jgi:small redox-active disulfide protein 2
MEIKVLGMGCPKCIKLYENVQTALQNSAIEAVVTKVEELPTILKYNVMSTPALVIDEKVVATGKLLSPEKIAEFLV